MKTAEHERRNLEKFLHMMKIKANFKVLFIKKMISEELVVMLICQKIRYPMMKTRITIFNEIRNQS